MAEPVIDGSLSSITTKLHPVDSLDFEVISDTTIRSKVFVVTPIPLGSGRRARIYNRHTTTTFKPIILKPWIPEV